MGWRASATGYEQRRAAEAWFDVHAPGIHLSWERNRPFDPAEVRPVFLSSVLERIEQGDTACDTLYQAVLMDVLVRGAKPFVEQATAAARKRGRSFEDVEDATQDRWEAFVKRVAAGEPIPNVAAYMSFANQGTLDSYRTSMRRALRELHHGRPSVDATSAEDGALSKIILLDTEVFNSFDVFRLGASQVLEWARREAETNASLVSLRLSAVGAHRTWDVGIRNPGPKSAGLIIRVAFECAVSPPDCSECRRRLQSDSPQSSRRQTLTALWFGETGATFKPSRRKDRYMWGNPDASASVHGSLGVAGALMHGSGSVIEALLGVIHDGHTWGDL